MPGKANTFGFDIVIEEVFIIYLTDVSQLANVKLGFFFFYKGNNAKGQQTVSLFIIFLTEAQSKLRKP